MRRIGSPRRFTRLDTPVLANVVDPLLAVTAIGLDVHEPPYIVEGNELEPVPRMVFGVEAGVYPTGEFGVRVEDLVVVVTGAGCERLNHSPRTWVPG